MPDDQQDSKAIKAGFSIPEALLDRAKAKAGNNFSRYLVQLIKQDLDNVSPPDAHSTSVITDIIPQVLGYTPWAKRLTAALDGADQQELLASLLLNLAVYLDHWGNVDFQLTSLRHMRRLIGILSWVERTKGRDTLHKLLFQQPGDEELYRELLENEKKINLWYGPTHLEEWDEPHPDLRSREYLQTAEDPANFEDEDTEHFHQQPSPAAKVMKKRPGGQAPRKLTPKRKGGEAG